MKKKIRNLIIVSLFIIISISMTYLVVGKNGIIAKAKAVETKADYGSSPMNNPYEGNSLEVIDERSVGNHLWRPILGTDDYGNTIIAYCIEPGAPLKGAGGKVPYSDLYNYVRRSYEGKFIAICDDYWIPGAPGIPGSYLYDYTRENYNNRKSNASNLFPAAYLAKDGNGVTPCYAVPDMYEKVYTQNDSYTGTKKVQTNNGTSTSNSNAPDLYDVGFILSYYAYGGYTAEQWSAAVQGAIWRSAVSESFPVSKETASGSEYGAYAYKESQEYQEFYRKIVARNGSSQDNPKMNPVDNTVRNEDGEAQVKVMTDANTGLVTVGPFNVDYVNSREDGLHVSFSGISDMYLVDSAGNRIEIEEIQTAKLHSYYGEYEEKDNKTAQEVYDETTAGYLNAKNSYINNRKSDDGVSFAVYEADNGVIPKFKSKGKPNYFSISGFKTFNQLKIESSNNGTSLGVAANNKNSQDYWDFIRYYPDSNEDFYVSYNPQLKNGETVAGVKLHVDFAFLKCEGSFIKRHTYQYALKENMTITRNYCENHSGVDHNWCNQSFDYSEQVELEAIDTQDLIIETYAKRQLIEESLEIPYKVPTDDVPGEPSGGTSQETIIESNELIDTTMKLRRICVYRCS